MTAAAILAVYVVTAATAGPLLLRRGRWSRAAPRWGIVAWQSLTVSIILSGVLAAAALALCMLPLLGPVAALVGLAPVDVVRHYEPIGGDWIGVLALSIAAVVLTVIAVRTGSTLQRAVHDRRRQLDVLALVGRPHAGGFTLIDHSTPVVYCLPGRGQTVVVSSGAHALLSEDELRVVISHERTHLRARHDLALTFSGVLAHTFSWIPAFRAAHEQIAMLVEMQADDAARVDSDRRSLARALVTLSGTRPPDAALAASGNDALARVRRLTAAEVKVPHAHKLGIAAAVLAVLVLPVGMALVPAMQATNARCCETVVGLVPRG